MSELPVSRRTLLKGLGAAGAVSFLPEINYAAPIRKPQFEYCLNMSTIRGHNLGFIKELETAAKAGFRSVEIWIDTLQTYLKTGGTLKDAKKLIDDLEITVQNAIGFAEWITDDNAARNKGLEQMKREMDMLAQIGCKRTAAPPVGATQLPQLDLKKVAERYRTILETGEQTGVMPHLELWGFSKNLGSVSEVMYVALESNHPSAKILLDVFHLYKGNSGLNTLHLVSPSAVEILHVNDYPANVSPEKITDADRIYPGDGVAPVRQILKTLTSPGKPLIISLEVFNKTYYSQDALQVAQTGLEKMKAITRDIEL